MNLSAQCITCTASWIYERLVAGTNLKTSDRFELMRSIIEILSKFFTYETSPGKVTNLVIEKLRDYLKLSRDHFEKIKKDSNFQANALIGEVSSLIDAEDDPKARIEKALTFSLYANVAPIGNPNKPFEFLEIKEVLKGLRSYETVSPEIINRLLAAQKIFFIADNAGEIGFDSILIRILKRLGKKITIVVKKDYFFDDATIRDVEYFGLDSIVDELIAIDYLFVPDTVDEQIRKFLKESDMIISKGTGNFESLRDERLDIPMLMLLKVKCEPIENYSSKSVGNFFIDAHFPKESLDE